MPDHAREESKNLVPTEINAPASIVEAQRAEPFTESAFSQTLRAELAPDRFLFSRQQLEILRRANIATDRASGMTFWGATQAADATFNLEHNLYLPYCRHSVASSQERAVKFQNLPSLIEQGADNYHRKMSDDRLHGVDADDSHWIEALYGLPGAGDFGCALDGHQEGVFIIFNESRKVASNIDRILKLTSPELSTPIVTKTDTFIELYIEVVPRFLTLLARDVNWEPNEINKALAIWSGEIELISCNHRYEQGSLYFDLSALPFTKDLRIAAERYLDAAIQVWSVLRDHLVEQVRYDV